MLLTTGKRSCIRNLSWVKINSLIEQNADNFISRISLKYDCNRFCHICKMQRKQLWVGNRIPCDQSLSSVDFFPRFEQNAKSLTCWLKMKMKGWDTVKIYWSRFVTAMQLSRLSRLDSSEAYWLSTQGWGCKGSLLKCCSSCKTWLCQRLLPSPLTSWMR